MLAGGTAPIPVYRKLVELSSDPEIQELWKRTGVYFGDERCVPPDDEQSNYRAAFTSLIEPLGIPDERVFRMKGEASNREQAAGDYERNLPKPIDVLLLGIGEDAHTASLFPGDPCAAKLLYGIAHVEGPKPPANRLTILPAVITQARERLVMVKGASKHEAVKKVLTSEWNPSQMPAQWALANPSTWLFDSEASEYQSIQTHQNESYPK
jgi:6-phosphogluconolactonase